MSSDDVRMGDSVAAEQTLHLFECLNKLKNALHRKTTNVSVDPIIKDLLELNYEVTKTASLLTNNDDYNAIKNV